MTGPAFLRTLTPMGWLLAAGIAVGLVGLLAAGLGLRWIRSISPPVALNGPSSGRPSPPPTPPRGAMRSSSSASSITA